MNLENYLYDGLNKDIPESGGLLIAEPMMEDTFVGRSVCLIIDTPETGGHAGLLLNKPGDVSLTQLLPDGVLTKELKVFCGGPVDLERLTVLHTLGDRLGNSLEIKPGLFIGAEIDKIIDYVEEGYPTEGKIRLFLGYCGWSDGQLASEIERKSWAVNNHRDSSLLLSGEGLAYWRREVELKGESLKSWLNVPPNPYCN